MGHLKAYTANATKEGVLWPGSCTAALPLRQKRSDGSGTCVSETRYQSTWPNTCRSTSVLLGCAYRSTTACGSQVKIREPLLRWSDQIPLSCCYPVWYRADHGLSRTQQECSLFRGKPTKCCKVNTDGLRNVKVEPEYCTLCHYGEGRYLAPRHSDSQRSWCRVRHILAWWESHFLFHETY